MAQGFEISVPITLKGGNEGEKVGRQIGSQISSQIKKLTSSIGYGGKTGGETGTSMISVSKGFKGIATKLGIIGAAIAAAVGLLAQSSPYLKGILSIFGRAFMMFFRPFGDFLATLLRPLAILLMKAAIAWLKLTRGPLGRVREAMNQAPQIPTTGNTLVDIPIQIANWALKLGAALGQIIFEIGKAAFNLGGEIGQWLYDKVILPIGNFISEKIIDAFNWVKGIGEKIWSSIIKPAWMFLSQVGQWIWNQIIYPAFNFLINAGYWIWNNIIFPAFNFLISVGRWIWDQIIYPAFNFLIDAGRWIWDQIIKPGLNYLNDLGYKIWNFVKGLFHGTIDVFNSVWGFIKSLFVGTISASSVWGFIKSLFVGGGSTKGYATGTSYVPSTGLYQLHQGEQVIPKNQVKNGNVVFKPTFQITGNVSKDIDIDAIVRRAGRMTKMELKQRGII